MGRLRVLCNEIEKYAAVKHSNVKTVKQLHYRFFTGFLHVKQDAELYTFLSTLSTIV